MKLPFCKPQSYTRNERIFLRKLKKQWLSFGIIEPSRTARTCCRVTLAKKGKDDIRTCYDGRPINVCNKSMQTYYTDKVKMVDRASSRHFWKSKVDLQSAYFQMPVHENSQYLLGIVLPDERDGHDFFHFKRMPFGVK